MTATERTGALVGLVVLVLGALLLIPLLTMGGGMMGGGMWGGPNPGGGMWGGTGGAPGWLWLVGVLLQIGLMVAVVALGYYLVRDLTDDDTDPAVAELRKAYARGDLTDEEFDRRRDRLEETRSRD